MACETFSLNPETVSARALTPDGEWEALNTDADLEKARQHVGVLRIDIQGVLKLSRTDSTELIRRLSEPEECVGLGPGLGEDTVHEGFVPTATMWSCPRASYYLMIEP